MNEEGKNKKKKVEISFEWEKLCYLYNNLCAWDEFLFFFLHNQQIIHSFGLFLMFSDPVAAKWKANLPVKIVV